MSNQREGIDIILKRIDTLTTQEHLELLFGNHNAPDIMDRVVDTISESMDKKNTHKSED